MAESQLGKTKPALRCCAILPSLETKHIFESRHRWKWSALRPPIATLLIHWKT